MSLPITCAGNIARVTVTFDPESGTVALADVTARAWGDRTLTVLDVVEDAPNVFHADVEIPDDAPAGTWVVRFESNSPSPKIAIESRQTSWTVTASALPSP